MACSPVQHNPIGLQAWSIAILVEPKARPNPLQHNLVVQKRTRVDFMLVGPAHSLFRLWVQYLDINSTR